MLLSKSGSQIKGKIIGDHVILDIVGKEVHYWSPQLNFRVEESEDNSEKSILSGLIGPKPSVWTLFMFIYFGVGILGFIVTSIGVSRYMLGEYSHLIWGFPIAILFMLTAYKAGKYGEQLGNDQIEILKQFIRDVITMKG